MEINSNKTDIWVSLMKLGAHTGCHQMHERSFSIKGYQLPVCARCTGLALGQLTAFILYSFLPTAPLLNIAIAAFLTTLLLAVDGFGQLFGHWVSNNKRRLLTGISCGFFTAMLLIKIVIILFGLL